MEQIPVIFPVSGAGVHLDIVAPVSGVIDFLNHFDYQDLDENCDCELCYRLRLTQTDFLIKSVNTNGHRQGCGCVACKIMITARSAYLAAQNRWMLFCEMSWHASQARGGRQLMIWLWGRLTTSRAPDSWWEHHGSELSILSWQREFVAEQRLSR